MRLTIHADASHVYESPPAITPAALCPDSGSSRRPATRGWYPGDPRGERQFAVLGPLALEGGGMLETTLAYESAGELNGDASNAVLVLHALTGDSHMRGPASEAHPSPGWWEHLIGPGKAIDTRRYFVVCPNVLGGCQGSTGPSSPAADGRPYGSRFPSITIRDQVRAERALGHHLGIDRWALVIGGSMGGMRVLEWAITYPGSVRAGAAIATTGRMSADALAFNCAQLAAIESCTQYARGDYYAARDTRAVDQALGVARRIAHTTYRSAREFEARFGNRYQGPEPTGRFAIESYLDHHARKLQARFDAGSYVHLVRAMNSHDVGRGRGGCAKALERIRAPMLIMAIDSDRLFPVDHSQQLHRAIASSRLVNVPCDAGHDGFLLENPLISREVSAILNAA